MQPLKDAIDLKLLDSTIFNTCGGRCAYQIGSPDYPRLVYSRVSGVPDNAFAKNGEEVLLQFDLFSISSVGIQEILTMESQLKTLLDDCTLTITGNVCVGFKRTNIISMSEEVDALPDGSTSIEHTAIDYAVTYQTA